MGAITSQITSFTIVYSTVYSGADQRKHQSSATLAFPARMASKAVNVSFDDVNVRPTSCSTQTNTWFLRISDASTPEVQLHFSLLTHCGLLTTYGDTYLGSREVVSFNNVFIEVCSFGVIYVTSSLVLIIALRRKCNRNRLATFKYFSGDSISSARQNEVTNTRKRTGEVL